MGQISANGVVAVCGAFLALTTIFVGLRLYARKRQQLYIKADDVFAIISWVSI